MRRMARKVLSVQVIICPKITYAEENYTISHHLISPFFCADCSEEGNLAAEKPTTLLR